MATKDVVVRVRLTVEEKVDLVGRCAREGVSVSEYVRGLIRGEPRWLGPVVPAEVPVWERGRVAEEAEREKYAGAPRPSAVQVAKRPFKSDFK